MTLKSIFTKRKTQNASNSIVQKQEKKQELFDQSFPYDKNTMELENEFNEFTDIPDEPSHAYPKIKKQRLEIISAVILMLVIGFVTWGQLAFFGTDTWVFFFLININAILMLVVLFLVARNVVKLLLERRRKIFGSRLRTRLVLAFFSISFVPILIMFLSANKILTTSVNYWFTEQVENSMQAALDVGQSFYNAASARLRVSTETLVHELINSSKNDWPTLIAKHKKENNLTLLGIMEKNQKSTSQSQSTYTEGIWVADAQFNDVWASIRHSINFQQIDQSRFESLLWPDPLGDYVIIALPIPQHKELYIIVAERFGKGLLNQLEKISTGFEEYTKLKNLKQPLKLSFSLILGLLSLIVLFAAVWLAFKISRELTQPILALAKGTKLIAQGDWNFQVIDKGQDELGQLVHSFNAMTNEMRHSQDRLKKMNWLIEEKNEILIERNQYIEAILEHITTGIVTLDDKGTLLTINKAACDIFKIRAEQYESLPITMFLSTEHSSLVAEMYASIQTNPDKIWIHEAEVLLQEQYLKILVQAVPLPIFMKENRNTDREPSEFLNEWEQKNTISATKNNAYLTGSVILVIEDITELSQEQRLAAWREVAQRIAHEIKNPLTPIKLSTQRIQRKFAHTIDDPVFTQCTELIIKEVSRMESMVKDFSTFAALSAICLEPENLEPILQELISLFRISHPSIAWNIIQKTDIPKLLLDKKALHRALFNILSNAADAIHAKKQKLLTPDIKKKNDESNSTEYTGNIDIIFFNTSLTNPDENQINQPQNHVIIEIQDNGAGIDAEEVARLFEPYFSKKTTGMGLGLPIARSIIADHGGNINAHSKDNGTCIHISLPY